MPRPSRYHGGTSYKDLTLEDWEQFWHEGKIFFHKTEVNASLLKHQDKLLRGKGKCRVLLPLCGKSLDMKWFLDQGHQVVGVEYSASAIEAFFRDHSIAYVKEPVHGIEDATLYKGVDKQLKIYCCDFFKFQSDIEGDFNVVWDRGALGAVNKKDRRKYGELMLTLLSPKAVMLISAFDYDSNEYVGPPLDIPKSDVFDIYQPYCTVEHIDVTDQLNEEKRSLGVTRFEQNIYLARLK